MTCEIIVNFHIRWAMIVRLSVVLNRTAFDSD